MYTDTKASSPNVRKCLSKLGICVRLARCLFHYKRILLHVLPYSSGRDVLDGIGGGKVRYILSLNLCYNGGAKRDREHSIFYEVKR